MSSEAITIRTRRLNALILKEYQTISRNKFVSIVPSRECLLDAFILLYNECDKDNLKKRDKNIAEFVSKYRDIIDETKALRLNSDDFHEKTLIGKGYFGNVHLVEEKATGDIYAMKKIKKSFVTASQLKEERDIMAERSSEWITNLQYSFQDSDFLYLVMEYLPGGDLLSLMLRNGPFEEEHVKFYLAEMSLAINDLHKMGYVHRDIKPENILIDRLGHIKLADFGNAAVLNEHGHVISVSPVGTPYYIAPELLQTISSYKVSKVHDVTCDFWSMGIIGYEMVYEITPFHNENVNETYSKILTYCEDSKKTENLLFPGDVKISESFKNIIENLVARPSKRFMFSKIKNHKFFENIKWESLHQQVPPFIPNVHSEDDVSNFEDIEKIRGKRNTYSSKYLVPNLKSNDFSGKDLPFLGYGYIHQEKALLNNLNESNDLKIARLNNKIKDMQMIMNNQKEEIKCLHGSLLNAEKKAKQADSTSKILSEAKDEVISMKERLKQKTIELTQCKTEIKTLQSSLKIEEEQRLKSDATISEVLRSTYKKWEKAKAASDQNYEKQIAEKKTEISNLTQKLLSRESELATKCEELDQVNTQIGHFKERVQSLRDQAASDKKEFEKIKLSMQETYEANLHDLRTKLRMEKDSKSRLTCELRDIRCELDESIQSTNNNIQAKITTEKNTNEIRQRLAREIELNNILRSENAKIEKLKNDIEKAYEGLRMEHEKLKQENQLREATKNLNLDSVESGLSSQYQSAHGSLTELHAVEEQLKNDLAIAKEREDKQRNRADHLEKIVSKLEDMIAKMNEQQKSMENNVLEKQNEKLEDKLANVREQMVIERQSARTANLSLWKVEKQIEDLQNEKKIIQRRMELTEDKMKRVQNQKGDCELHIKGLQSEVKLKDNQIKELKDEIKNLKEDLKKEHQAWQKAEEERMQEKSEVLEHVNKVHKLNEKVEDLNQKLLQSRSRLDNLSLENKRLLRELNEEREQSSSSFDLINELQTKLKSSQENYEMVKIACSITDQQLTEIEILLDTEIKKNKSNQEKIDSLYKSVRGKEEVISQLKKDLNVETSKKIEAENKIKSLQSDNDDIKDNLEYVHKQLISQQNQLINTTNDLFTTQEKLELATTELNNLQIINENFEKETTILKEENARILTEYFLTKEENNRFNQELKTLNQNIRRYEEEIEQVNNSLEEQKNYYIQRDIKSEATLMQHKKLIDYLQLKIEDLSQKKKKSFADKLFGSATPNAKKENLNPNSVESSILYRTLQEELNREKQKNKMLQEQLEKQKLIYQQQSSNNANSPTKIIQTSSPCKSKPQHIDSVSHQGIELYPDLENLESVSTTSKTRNQNFIQVEPKNHRFELNLDTNETNKNCVVCSREILSGSPHWFCKECKCTVHRKCRTGVNNNCGFMENNRMIESNVKNIQQDENDVRRSSIRENGYHGDFILSTEIVDPPLEINCAYEIMSNIILLGTTTGLFAYDLNLRSLLKIDGVQNVQCISESLTISKILMVANDGNDVLQCDYRQLQNRSQSKPSMKPCLQATKIDFSQVAQYHDKFKLVKISNESEAVLTNAIAIGSHQIIFMKYEVNSQNFKALRSLQCSTLITSILFTRHTVIISSDKFLEIDLSTYAMEEFIDFSDPTLNHLQNYQPMSIFNISSQEYLVCFAECGIFVDEYGCRSRPYELTWEYTPTGFLYQEPFLYISHFQLVQVIRLYRSYRNEIANNMGSNEVAQLKRTYLNIYMSTLLGSCGNNSCYSLALNRGSGIQELFLINSLKALKSVTSISSETLSSEATCLTTESESSRMN